MELLVIIGLCFLSYALIQVTFLIFGIGNGKNLPPGPIPLPIIGNLHLLGDQPHKSLTKLAKIHGPVMSIKLGQITTIVISSVTAAKEVLQKQDLDFSSRYIPDALNAHNLPQYSVVWLPVGTQWRSLRKLLNSIIFSSSSLDSNQHLRSKKVDELIAYCRKASQSNDSVNIGRATFRTAMNLLSNTMFSKDLMDPYEDSGMEFRELIGNMSVEAAKPNLADYFPVLQKMDIQGIRRRFGQHSGKVLEIFKELINERLGMEKLKQDDVLDECLKINQEKPDEISLTHITSLVSDLLTAGTDTSSNTLEWAMTELLRNPHTMAKAKEELKEVIGKGKTVKENDVSKLPYLSSIIKETLRMHSPAPLLLPRKVKNQVKLYGYTIPEGSQVLVNAYAIGRDPTIWEDSLEFKPERFLASSIDVKGQDFELIPFGAGRRICPGLPLAMRMISMMLGSLLNNFDWRLDKSTHLKDLDISERFGITLQKAFPLCAVPVPLN